MTRRKGMVIAVLAAVLVLGWLAWDRGGERAARTTPGDAERSRSAAATQKEPAAERPAAKGGPAQRPRMRTPADRAKLAIAIERARQARQRREAPAPSTGAGASPAPEPLAIANKTGSDTDWEKRQLEVLGQLIGECFDLAKVDDPELAGALGVTFSIAAEPEVGGLVSNIDFMADYSTIESAAMRECTRESLYALELDPPPDGVQVDRQLTLRLGD